jgi:TPR repeat protein
MLWEEHCGGCEYSFSKSVNDDYCPFCNSDRTGKTNEKSVEEMMKRVEVNDAGAMTALGNWYHLGQLGLQQDQAKAMELWTRAADLVSDRREERIRREEEEG